MKVSSPPPPPGPPLFFFPHSGSSRRFLLPLSTESFVPSDSGNKSSTARFLLGTMMSLLFLFPPGNKRASPLLASMPAFASLPRPDTNGWGDFSFRRLFVNKCFLLSCDGFSKDYHFSIALLPDARTTIFFFVPCSSFCISPFFFFFSFFFFWRRCVFARYSFSRKMITSAPSFFSPVFGAAAGALPFFPARQIGLFLHTSPHAISACRRRGGLN